MGSQLDVINELQLLFILLIRLIIFNNKLLDYLFSQAKYVKNYLDIPAYQVMTTPAQRRLLKDLQKIQKEEDSGFMCCPINDNLLLWIVTFQGAQNTIWEGGLFTLRLLFTQKYPNTPPRVKFLNKMFHPNIYNDGRICLDMLYNQWSPIYDVWALLTAIKALLTDPNTQSPANIEASNIFRDNKVLYEFKVKQVVQKSLQFVGNDDQIAEQAQRQIKQKQAEQAKALKQQKRTQWFNPGEKLKNRNKRRNGLFLGLASQQLAHLTLKSKSKQNNLLKEQSQPASQQLDESSNDEDSEEPQSQQENEMDQPQQKPLLNSLFQKFQNIIQSIDKQQMQMVSLAINQSLSDKENKNTQSKTQAIEKNQNTSKEVEKEVAQSLIQNPDQEDKKQTLEKTTKQNEEKQARVNNLQEEEEEEQQDEDMFGKQKQELPKPEDQEDISSAQALSSDSQPEA